MQCILCEKPSAAKNYAVALGGRKGYFNGKEYQIVNSIGHIFQMPTPEKQVDKNLVEKYKSWNLSNLPWNYKDIHFNKVLNAKFKDTFNTIKTVAKECDEFIIATDDDPTGEGTLLANEIIEALKLKGVRYYRSFHVDESPKEIRKAMCNLKDLGYDPKTDSDYIKANFRSKWDYLSMQWTRIFTHFSSDGCSVLRQGRLKSYMVWVVGEQIKAVNEYKKIPFYQNRFIDENEHVYISKKEEQFPNKEDVPVNKYKKSDVILDSEEKKYKAPPVLYDLNMLSASLAPKGFTSKQVLETYQAMYENHIVSYPRTEDKTITPEQFNEFLNIADAVAKVVGVDTALLSHRMPRKTHVKPTGSHGANRPANNVPKSLIDLKKDYGDCGVLIYQFVARNALAMLCEDYEYMHQIGHIKDYPDFIGTANIPVSYGYKQIFNDEKEADENVKELGKKAEPFIHEGFPPKPAWPTAKWLANLLKKNDVGTGATRASIYGDVTDPKAKYPLLIDKKGKIYMTNYGEMSYVLLKDTHIGDVTLTENLQKQMKEVANGADYNVYLQEIASLLVDDIKTVEQNSKLLSHDESVNTETQDFSFACPNCGKLLTASFKAVYCAKQNGGCGFIVYKRIASRTMSNEEIADLLLHNKTSLLKGFTSKAGKKFSARLTFDKDYKVIFTR